MISDERSGPFKKDTQQHCKESAAKAADAVPQVKVCGLTRVEEALACVELGVHAIGCVFYPLSPRHVTEQQARSICLGLPAHVWSVGVFVNATLSSILHTVECCGLRAVQLHGNESKTLVQQLRRAGLLVVKAVFVNGTPAPENAARFGASAYLMENGGGRLPGGNALRWNWGTAARFGRQLPLILAGGLNAENVTEGIEVAMPDAVDVSSGVEASPGRKDMAKVKQFLEAVARAHCRRKPRGIFCRTGVNSCIAP